MSERDLWAAAVLQSAEDLRDANYNEIEYSEAAAFFFDGGPWGESRRAVADQLALHQNDLTRLGHAVRFQRFAVDGGPPAAKRAVSPPLAIVPTLVPDAPQVERMPPAKPPRKPRPVRDRNWWIEQFLAREAA